LAQPQRRFVITGSPQDESRCQVLRQMFLDRDIPASIMVGRNGLSEIAHLLLNSELLISVNTGIMHLGAILGTRTIALNGPTAIHRWGALGRNAINLSPSDGSGGFLDLGFEYRGHLENVMDRISVAQVMNAIAYFGQNRPLSFQSELSAEPHLDTSYDRK
jgi:heptosyltransferase III